MWVNVLFKLTSTGTPAFAYLLMLYRHTHLCDSPDLEAFIQGGFGRTEDGSRAIDQNAEIMSADKPIPFAPVPGQNSGSLLVSAPC